MSFRRVDALTRGTAAHTPNTPPTNQKTNRKTKPKRTEEVGALEVAVQDRRRVAVQVQQPLRGVEQHQQAARPRQALGVRGRLARLAQHVEERPLLAVLGDDAGRLQADA